MPEYQKSPQMRRHIKEASKVESGFSLSKNLRQMRRDPFSQESMIICSTGLGLVIGLLLVTPHNRNPLETVVVSTTVPLILSTSLALVLSCQDNSRYRSNPRK